MKNKIAICAVMALLFAPAAANARWGLDFTGVSGKMDGKDLNTDRQSHLNGWLPSSGWKVDSKVEQDAIAGEAKLFVEGNSRFHLGASIGFGGMPGMLSKFEGTQGTLHEYQTLDARSHYIPVDLYLKFNSKGGKFSVFGGGGADYMKTTTQYQAGSSSGFWEKATFEQTKTVPHAQAGCELFLAKWLSVNVGVKYVFSAIFDNLTGNLTGSAGVVPGKYRMTMKKFSYGETMDARLTSAALGANERPFKYDLSGARATVGLKVYFK